MVPTPFGQRLRAAMDELGPLCVGIDPHPGLLQAWGLPDDAAGLRAFSFAVLEATAGLAAAVKPQSALFERHGARGVAVLAEVVQNARELGTLCIVDAKRGDIGSTMEGYADAYLSDSSDLAADAVTLSPFLGFGSLSPAIDKARQTGRGVFILCLTSNPEGASVQHAISPATNQAVAAEIAAAAAALNAADIANQGWQNKPTSGADSAQSPALPLGSVGLVVGATIGEAARQTATDLTAVHGPLLAPGVGAQGGGPAELRSVFGSARHNVLASSSREILKAGPDVAALRAATNRSRETVTAALRD
ncbi:MAG: orotidine-5'-phosphate decarboxylase [Cellulomonadaceae bacterium]|nr:orotidine-5'-phosphate decarboxylase [Cellulomonadaceae bacterium]